jgi:uncharacterized protein (DUF433 family)
MLKRFWKGLGLDVESWSCTAQGASKWLRASGSEISNQGFSLQEAKSKHLYIEINPKICGGSPVIKGTRVRVVDIVMEYEYLECSPDEIVTAHPHIKLEQVHDALSYYYENRERLDQKIREDKEFVRRLTTVDKGKQG